MARGVEHVGGTVHRYHAADVRRHCFRQLSRAAAEVADDERRIDQPEHRPQKELVAEELAAQVIPSAGRRREKLLGLRPAPRQHAAKTPIVLPGCRRRGDLLADERPQPLGARVEVVHRHAVEPARAVTPRRDPVVVGQGLQMAADPGLRHLQHRAQLRDRQLVLSSSISMRQRVDPRAPSCGPGWGQPSIRKSGYKATSHGHRSCARQPGIGPDSGAVLQRVKIAALSRILLHATRSRRPNSGDTRSPRCWARAAWERSIEPATRS